MNSYQVFSSATVMLNLNRAETTTSNVQAKDSGEREFKKVFAAETSNKTSSKQVEKKDRDNFDRHSESSSVQSSKSEQDDLSTVANSSENNSDKPTDNNVNDSRQGATTEAQGFNNGNKEVSAEVDAEPQSTEDGIDNGLNAEQWVENTTSEEGINQTAVILNANHSPAGDMPGDESLSEEQLINLQASSFDSLSADVPVETPGAEETLENSEAETLIALFNWIASSVRSESSGVVAPVADADSSPSQPINSSLAKAITDLVSQNKNPLLGQTEQLTDLEEGTGKAGLMMQTAEIIKAQPSLSMSQLSTQMALPITTVATTIDSLMKVVKGQFEGGSVRESGSVGSSSGSGAASAAMSAFGRSLEGLKPAAGGTILVPDQLKGTVGQPQWQTAIAERVAIMASQRITSAEIQLDPPELGQLQVRVTLNQEQANVSFVSQHALVREALDQSAFRLREMFTAEGLNLVDVDVSGETFQQQREAQSNKGDGNYAASGDGEPEAELPLVEVSTNLVDHFV